MPAIPVFLQANNVYTKMTQPKRYLVPSAHPYANGLKHVGHLAGVYIPADIYTRYLRAQKRDVVFVSKQKSLLHQTVEWT